MKTVAEEYREIYTEQMSSLFDQEIKKYTLESGINEYQPLSHNCVGKCNEKCNHHCYRSLGRLGLFNLLIFVLMRLFLMWVKYI